MKNNDYIRLATGKTLEGVILSGVKQYLMLAHDHIAIVKSGPFSESVSYIRLADIQAISCMNVNSANIYTLVASCITAIAAVLISLSPYVASTGNSIYFMQLAIVLPLIPLWLILLYVPSCVTTLDTSVQKVRLACLSKRGKAHKAISVLSERITAIQGVLTPSQMHAINNNSCIMNPATVNTPMQP